MKASSGRIGLLLLSRNFFANIMNKFKLGILGKCNFICGISGSHGGEYEVQSLLGCTAM
jgi:hypothetical protein